MTKDAKLLTCQAVQFLLTRSKCAASGMQIKLNGVVERQYEGKQAGMWTSCNTNYAARCNLTDMPTRLP
jgi:hypothetical protein